MDHFFILFRESVHFMMKLSVKHMNTADIYRQIRTSETPQLSLRYNLAASEGRVVYVLLILILILFIALLLYAYLQRTKRNQILQNSEQIRTDFFTKVTHEFRTPLTIILGLSKQLREQKDFSNNNSLTYLTAIERQGRNLSVLVNQLLDVANLKAADKTMEWETGNIVAFLEMISETYRLYAEQKGMDMIFYSEETNIETDFVPNYLNKIVQNLLSNAIRYSEEGSRIFLIVERSKKDKKKMLIKVVDHGKGISHSDLPHIFELFYRDSKTDEQMSNGIGLTLTKQLVEILGGKISVESDVGKGTVFTVELPIYRNEKQLYPYWMPDMHTAIPIADKLPSKLPVLDNKEFFSFKPNENDPRTTILLVEDNKDVALYIRALFKEDTYIILYANNGEKALAMANEYIPDIVITDIIMPKKSGKELCKDIRSSPLLNHIPIIILSAMISEVDFVDGLKSGADAYIRKPFNSEELRVRVEKLLENRNRLKEKYLRSIFKEEKTGKTPI
jgi:Signal transduction histidine kinase